MPIHYALFENNLTADPTDFIAVVQMTDTTDLNGVVDRIIQGGSTLGRPDILATLEAAIAACEALLLDGRRLNFGGLVELFPRVRGNFTGAADTFDPARHAVDVGANPGSRIRQGVRANATVVKDEAILPAPNPLEFRDLGSNTTNGQITSGNIGTLTGSRLKFNPAAADEGVYCVPTGGGAATKVTAIQQNQPAQVVFLNPTLVAGTYQLEVRSRQRGSTQLRTGQLDAVLTVV